MPIAQWTLIVNQVTQGLKTLKVAERRRVLTFLLAASTLWVARAFGESPAFPESVARHAVVISVDGLMPNSYVSPSPGLRVPNLTRLKQEGSSAEGVVGVYPSVTYPSHTTLVTGRMPAEHGVYSNLSSREAGKNPDDWFWFASAIKVPTLWDEVRRRGLKSASVSWPVTAGAEIDWNVPEIWEPGKGEAADYEYIAKHSTPGLIQEALATLGPPQPGTDEDTVRTRFAIYLLKKYKPDLLLVHLADLDGSEHEHGANSPEAIVTLERVDVRIGEILAAIKEAGIEDVTDVFIVSDHGFLPVDRHIQPNVLLARAGLLRADERGNVVSGRVATVAQGGSFYIYWPESQNLRDKIDVALKPLRGQGLLWAVLGRPALRDLGVEPAAQMVLEAPEGFSFGDQAKGEIVTKMREPGGTHGYLPFRQGLEASFIAWGPRIKSGVNLHRIPMTAIAPTILKDLGMENPQFGAQPPLVDILK